MSSAQDNPRKVLGRGLSALIPNRTTPIAGAPMEPSPEAGVLRIPIDQIDPNPMQPRAVFQSERLNELSQSILANGIIQPLVVRRAGSRYQLVAGERRWRAAKMAGLTEVPVIVQDFANDKLLEITLVENIQREDLNAIEVAHAFDKLARELHLSHEEIGRRTGKDRTTITNMLRLLKLPGDVQLLLAEHRLSMGHARALLALPTPELQCQVAERAAGQGMSVRQVEQLVSRMTSPREAKTVEEATEDPNVKAAIQEMERVLGTRVRIVEKAPQRGRIEIDYYSMEDVHRIYGVIVGDEAKG